MDADVARMSDLNDETILWVGRRMKTDKDQEGMNEQHGYESEVGIEKRNNLQRR